VQNGEATKRFTHMFGFKTFSESTSRLFYTAEDFAFARRFIPAIPTPSRIKARANSAVTRRDGRMKKRIAPRHKAYRPVRGDSHA